MKNHQFIFALLKKIASRNNLPELSMGMSNDYEDAIKYYEEATKLNPDYHVAQYNLANTYKTIGRYDKAIEKYELSFLKKFLIVLFFTFRIFQNNKEIIIKATNKCNDNL